MKIRFIIGNEEYETVGDVPSFGDVITVRKESASLDYVVGHMRKILVAEEDQIEHYLHVDYFVEVSLTLK